MKGANIQSITLINRWANFIIIDKIKYNWSQIKQNCYHLVSQTSTHQWNSQPLFHLFMTILSNLIKLSPQLQQSELPQASILIQIYQARKNTDQQLTKFSKNKDFRLLNYKKNDLKQLSLILLQHRHKFMTILIFNEPQIFPQFRNYLNIINKKLPLRPIQRNKNIKLSKKMIAFYHDEQIDKSQILMQALEMYNIVRISITPIIKISSIIKLSKSQIDHITSHLQQTFPNEIPRIWFQQASQNLKNYFFSTSSKTTLAYIFYLLDKIEVQPIFIDQLPYTVQQYFTFQDLQKKAQSPASTISQMVKSQFQQNVSDTTTMLMFPPKIKQQVLFKKITSISKEIKLHNFSSYYQEKLTKIMKILQIKRVTVENTFSEGIITLMNQLSQLYMNQHSQIAKKFISRQQIQETEQQSVTASDFQSIFRKQNYNLRCLGCTHFLYRDTNIIDRAVNRTKILFINDQLNYKQEDQQIKVKLLQLLNTGGGILLFFCQCLENKALPRGRHFNYEIVQEKLIKIRNCLAQIRPFPIIGQNILISPLPLRRHQSEKIPSYRFSQKQYLIRIIVRPKVNYKYNVFNHLSKEDLDHNAKIQKQSFQSEKMKNQLSLEQSYYLNFQPTNFDHPHCQTSPQNYPQKSIQINPQFSCLSNEFIIIFGQYGPLQIINRDLKDQNQIETYISEIIKYVSRIQTAFILILHTNINYLNLYQIIKRNPFKNIRLIPVTNYNIYQKRQHKYILQSSHEQDTTQKQKQNQIKLTLTQNNVSQSQTVFFAQYISSHTVNILLYLQMYRHLSSFQREDDFLEQFEDLMYYYQ